MEIQFKNNTSFGTKVPTIPYLKSALGMGNYSDGKELCLALGIKFPGYEGFYGKANKLASQSVEKNKFLEPYLHRIQDCVNITDKAAEIEKICSEIGQNIDVTI